jgi:hypothetical protein
VYGAQGVGIDIDPALVQEATRNARDAGVSDKVRFLAQDLFTTDISPATVVSLYLTPFLNFKLLPKLNKELKPGTRVVSHQWEMMDPSDKYEYKPDQKLIVGNSFIYVWTVPIVRKDGFEVRRFEGFEVEVRIVRGIGSGEGDIARGDGRRARALSAPASNGCG